VLTTILRDNPSKLAVGNEVDDLGKYETSGVHNIGTLPKAVMIRGEILQSVLLQYLMKVTFLEKLKSQQDSAELKMPARNNYQISGLSMTGRP